MVMIHPSTEKMMVHIPTVMVHPSTEKMMVHIPTVMVHPSTEKMMVHIPMVMVHPSTQKMMVHIPTVMVHPSTQKMMVHIPMVTHTVLLETEASLERDFSLHLTHRHRSSHWSMRKRYHRAPPPPQLGWGLQEGGWEAQEVGQKEEQNGPLLGPPGLSGLVAIRSDVAGQWTGWSGEWSDMGKEGRRETGLYKQKGGVVEGEGWMGGWRGGGAKGNGGRKGRKWEGEREGSGREQAN